MKAWNKIIFKESLKDDFLLKFRNLFKKIREVYEAEDNSASDMLTNLIQLFQDVAVKMQYKDKPNVKLNKQPDWWNLNCDLAKKEKYQTLRQFRKTNTESDFELSTRARNKFKEITKQSKCENQCKKRRELVDLRKEPKSFWKNIKQCARNTLHSKNTENISGKQWYDYFEKLLSSSVTSIESEKKNIRKYTTR